MEPEDGEIVVGSAEDGMGRATGDAAEDIKVAGTRSKALPQFSFRSFVEDVDRQKRIEEERRRVEAEEKRERKEMWTTPGQRPLAEPLIMDWDYIRRALIHSDAQYAALFPGKPDKVARQKDLDFEVAALSQHYTWTWLMANDPDTSAYRRRFYENLRADIVEELREASAESNAHHHEADPLGQFEFEYLDEKGGTLKMEQHLLIGVDPFHFYGPFAREKYGYLVPHDFKINMLATWEARHLSWDWDVSRIASALQNGNNIFLNGHPEIRCKYAYLIPPDYEFRKWLRGQLNTEEATRRLKECIARGVDIFLFSDPPEDKDYVAWPQLVPEDFVMDPVSTFEFYWLDRGTTLKIEWYLERGWDVFRGWGNLVEEKYGHLRSHLLPRDDFGVLSSTDSDESGGSEVSNCSQDYQEDSYSMMRLNDQHRHQASTDSDGNISDASEGSYRSKDDQEVSHPMMPLGDQHIHQASSDIDFNISDESDGSYYSVNGQERSDPPMPLSGQYDASRSADSDSDSDEADGSGSSHHSEDDQPESHNDRNDDGEMETSSSRGNSLEEDQEESSQEQYSDGQETISRSGDNLSESESIWDGSGWLGYGGDYDEGRGTVESCHEVGRKGARIQVLVQRQSESEVSVPSSSKLL